MGDMHFGARNALKFSALSNNPDLLVLIQRMQKLGLVLMLRQRLVPEQRRLRQERVKLLIEEGRKQLLLGWKHQLSSGGR